MNRFDLSQKSGQSLTEYALPIALVCILGITILGVLGTQVSGIFSNTLATKPPSKTPSNPINQSPVSSGGTSNNNLLANLPGKLLSVDIGNGQTLQLNYINAGDAAETAGPNGVTQNSLAGLQQIIQQFEQMPTSDPVVITSLKQLAQKGYETQMYQQVYSDFLKSGGSSPDQETLTDNYAKMLEYGKPVISLPDGSKISLFDLKQYIGSNTAPASASKLPPTKFMESFDKVYALDMTSVKGSNNGNNNFKGLQGFTTQLALIEKDGIFTKYPGLKPLLVDVLSKDLYAAAYSTAMSNNLEAIKGYTQRVGWRSDDICVTSRASSCKATPGKG
ncbi:MAG: hypothetical protein K2X66_07890 [Cyanobacteria bacterium]|nr:hypothetical protein [Cyanobacteriota bacterium]